jgi:hypothetical protein
VEVRIIIDGEQFVIIPKKVNHLIEFLDIIRMQYLNQYRYIHSISVNGQIVRMVTESFLNAIWSQSSRIVIQIETQPIRKEYLTLWISKLAGSIARMCLSVELVAEYFFEENIKQGEQSWLQVLKSIDWLVVQMREVNYYLRSFVDPQQKPLLDKIPKAIENLSEDLQTSLQNYYVMNYKEFSSDLDSKVVNSLKECQGTLSDLQAILDYHTKSA